MSKPEKFILDATAIIIVLAFLVSPSFAFSYDFRGQINAVYTGTTVGLKDGRTIKLACIAAKAGALDHLCELVWKHPNVSYDFRLQYFIGDSLCVIYTAWNESHLINVNRAMVIDGYASASDFSLYQYPLFVVVVDMVPEFSPFLTVVFMLLSSSAIVLLWKRLKADGV